MGIVGSGVSAISVVLGVAFKAHFSATDMESMTQNVSNLIPAVMTVLTLVGSIVSIIGRAKATTVIKPQLIPHSMKAMFKRAGDTDNW